LRRSLPHTNPYQEHKNKRLVRRVGLTGRAKNKGNRKGGGEDSHHGDEDQISTRNQAFHGGELKSPWRGPRRRVPREEGEETKRKLFLQRGGHKSVFEDRQIGLTGTTNWSDRSPLIAE
jgi:hypothetical protein